MRKTVLLTVLLIALAAPAAAATAMTLTSQDVRAGMRVPPDLIYGNCDGDNVSPQLAWSGAPAGTKSFAVTLFDPDAAGGGWWHWIVFDIAPGRTSLPRGAGDPMAAQMPAPAVQGTNDFGRFGYGGPCPPAGDKPHRYIFTVWALDAAKAPFGAAVIGSTLQPWLKRHMLGSAQITATYSR